MRKPWFAVTTTSSLLRQLVAWYRLLQDFPSRTSTDLYTPEARTTRPTLERDWAGPFLQAPLRTVFTKNMNPNRAVHGYKSVTPPPSLKSSRCSRRLFLRRIGRLVNKPCFSLSAEQPMSGTTCRPRSLMIGEKHRNKFIPEFGRRCAEGRHFGRTLLRKVRLSRRSQTPGANGYWRQLSP